MAARISRQNPGNGGDQPSAQEALPWGSLSRGAGSDVPFCPLRLKSLLGLPTSARKPTRASRKGVQPQNKTKRGKTKQAREAMKHPCRLASEKRASEGGRVIPRESKKSPARGPEWHPDKTPERKDARPKREINPVAAGTQTRKRTRTHKCVWGCALLLPELSLLKKKETKKKDDDVGEKKPKEERKENPKHQT